MTKQQMLKELEGCEVRIFNTRLETEFGVVGIHNGKVMEGKKEFKVNKFQVKDLFYDFLYQEGITNSQGKTIL